ncbi:hypothetical protein VP1G_05509 [Cytospora mali]|uniref:Lysine-specific metallo-endopeptidase domain-containing protein n=1 Tax=Cytospora mali TaxID=578113 RepID=A0A194V2W7_CYTMA|nr:hypothetical protein VP1G_05509 [Valsa mali var. pyri (nom. inval.)]
MAIIQFIILSILAGLLPYSVYAAPALHEESPSWFPNNDDVLASWNSTLEDRSGNLGKREVFNKCNNGFSDLMATALQDANDIMLNMVAHLELAVALFNGSGELIPSKVARASRTFDEQNAIMSYRAFIANSYFGAGNASNPAGYAKLVNTFNLAKTVQTQFANYLSGTSVPWTRNGIPYLYIFCTDEDLYSATNQEGLTYTEDTGYANPQGSIYWVSASQVTEGNGNVWDPLRGVCDLGDGATGRFLNPTVPILTGVKAYTAGAHFGLIEEKIVFCPAYHARWEAYDATTIQSGLHYRNMHVAIGDTPTTQQATYASTLATGRRNIAWFQDFVVKTLIHEATHAVAFVTPANTKLVDIGCTFTVNGVQQTQTTVDPGCLMGVANGTYGLDANGNAQGHKDAEAFATYAMAVWLNNVYWYTSYRAKVRP